jgi:Ca2+-transporting ATPase
METNHTIGATPAWHTLTVEDVARTLETDVAQGLSDSEVARRLARWGPNSLPREQPPSLWRLCLVQLRDPMNLMLLAVVVASLFIGQALTTILVAGLVTLNVILGASQELKARGSIDALRELQVPDARVRRGGSVHSVPAVDLVPGDTVLVEAGDVVPADGRLAEAASLEVQESALTGESEPVDKGVSTLPHADIALGDRANLLFQNTSVTRGTGTYIVTGTGAATEMGSISGMLHSVDRSKSPLQREMNDLTRWLGFIAWTAVAVIFLVGLFRGLDSSELVLLGVATAISAIPTGLPTFVQALLASGARRLTEAKAVVKSLADVETLGATTVINSDKTGTLTLNQMTVTQMLVDGSWFTVAGSGYDKRGSIRTVAGEKPPDFTYLAYGLTLCSDATVTDDGTVVGDPTEAALVVLAAKIGVDAESSRREIPRISTVPFDSAYKFMATFHLDDDPEHARIVELVKGAPDVLLARCSTALWKGDRVPVAQVRDQLLQANVSLSERGLRVLSFAYREFSPDSAGRIEADPVAQVEDLVFVALVGIIDPLRPEAKDAVAVARRAGIDVRMITGDHAVTARSIADDLRLGPGAITGPELQRASDDEVLARLAELHVFGRVAPEDKLRLVSLMQQSGEIVAMTGDAVNDAAALKKADIGVAMGSGSEVSKQAARMILTDDNFATLVHSVEIGRDVYDKITSYIRYQLSGLFGVLLLMLSATAFNINSGIALTPSMLLFINFVIGIFPVTAIIGDSPDPHLMDRAPRRPEATILNRRTGPRWLAIGLALALVSLVPLVFGPDEPSTDAASVSMTMTFAVAALSTVGLGLVLRRDPAPAWRGPLFPYLGWLAIAATLTVLAVELPALQRLLTTESLTGGQWLAILGLASVTPVAIEVGKAARRRMGAVEDAQSTPRTGPDLGAPRPSERNGSLR